MTDDTRKLLGGYATGTLSDDEKKLLFDAALTDDELFAALADEQALKELLDDGTVRAQVLRATEEPKFSLAGALREWFDRPKAKALVATGAVLLAIIGFNSVRQVPPSMPQMAKFHRIPTTPEQSRDLQPNAERAEPPDAQLMLRQSKPEIRQDKSVNTLRKQMAVAQAPKSEADQVVVSANPPSSLPAPPPAAAPKPEPVTSASARLSETSRRAAVPAATGGVIGGVVGGVPAFQYAAVPPLAPLRYELLRMEADGEFRPVPADYEFTLGDTIRVRVTSDRNGAVAVSSAKYPTVAGKVVANQATVLPAAGGIAVNADTDKIVLAFSAVETDLSIVRRAASAFTASDAVMPKQANPPPATIEIRIRHRQP